MQASDRVKRVFRRTAVVLIAVAVVLASFGWVERERNKQEEYKVYSAYLSGGAYRFGDHLLVPTRVGDMPPKLFLLDTGATSNCISPAAAREVTKVQGDPNTLVKGISGSVKSVYSANRTVLQFGHLRQENQEMLSFDMTSISDSEQTEVSGLLGFVTLRLLVLKIDYRDGLVDFDYDPKCLTIFRSMKSNRHSEW